MIRLVSVIGHGVDLIPHFIKHYSQYVDEICIVVYESDIEKNLFDDVSEIIKGYSNTKIVKRVYDRKFDWHRVTTLYNEVKNTEPNSWWVVADVDEFHLYPHNDLNRLISICDKNGWDLVRGGFIDRVGVDGEFVSITKDTNIFKQFPNAGFFRYPLSKACPNKVCVMKGHIEISDGQHYAVIDGHTTWRWMGWCHPLIAPYQELSVQVHHFKWDETSKNRIRQVANVMKEYAFSEEYRLMYRQLAKMRFKIDLSEEEFMFCESPNPDFDDYKKWNKLINKIVSI